MVEILGEYYYIDIEKINTVCEIALTPTENDEGKPLQIEQTINVFKYDTVKICIDTVLTEASADDSGMGLLNTELSIPFKVAFNTLIKYGILVKDTEYE
jgi:hypothetical protein